MFGRERKKGAIASGNEGVTHQSRRRQRAWGYVRPDRLVEIVHTNKKRRRMENIQKSQHPQR